MRAVVSSLLVAHLMASGPIAAGQASQPAAPPTTQPAPATPAPRTTPTTPPRPVQSPSSRRPAGANATVVVKVTDSFGAPLGGVRVMASGPVARSGSTDPNGEVRFSAVRGGIYRLRFESEKTITFEREVTVGAAQPPSFEVSLNPAPPPPAPPPAPKPDPAPVARSADLPPPEAKTVGIPDFVERNLITGREPSKSTLVACGANSVTNLIQIREPLKDQSHPGADLLLYVVGGEGQLLLGGQQIALSAGTFSVVPRGSTYTLQRRGNRGLILLSTMTDTPCNGR
jgi:hypothetical protein